MASGREGYFVGRRRLGGQELGWPFIDIDTWKCEAREAARISQDFLDAEKAAFEK